MSPVGGRSSWLWAARPSGDPPCKSRVLTDAPAGGRWQRATSLASGLTHCVCDLGKTFTVRKPQFPSVEGGDRVSSVSSAGDTGQMESRPHSRYDYESRFAIRQGSRGDPLNDKNKTRTRPQLCRRPGGRSAQAQPPGISGLARLRDSDAFIQVILGL